MNFIKLSILFTRFLTIPTFVILSFAGMASTEAKSLISSEAHFVISKEEIRRLSVQQTGRIEFLRESLTTSGEFPVILRQLKFNSTYEVEVLNPGEGGGFDLILRLPQVRMNIESLTIDTVLEVKTGGIRTQIPVKAQCRGLLIQNREELRLSLKAQWEELPHLQARVQEVQWVRRPEQWSVRAESCEAAPGFVPFLAGQISKLWQESEELPLTLKEEINAHLSVWFAEKLSLRQEMPLLRTQVHLQGRRFVDTPEAWVFGLDLGLEIGLEGDRLCPSLTTPLHFSFQDVVSDISGLEIRVPEKLLQSWVRCLHEKGTLARFDRGQDITGFRQLLNSRFLQFFVWSDVMRFSKSTPFQFQTFSNGVFRFEPADLEMPGVNYSLQTQVVSHLSYPVNQRWHPYMSFWTPVVTGVNLQIKDAKLRVGMSGALRTQLQYRYDVPEGRGQVRIGLIEDQVKDHLKGQSFEIDLPDIRLENLILKPSSLQRVGPVLKMKLEAKR